MFSLNSMNSMTKITVKMLFKPATSCVRDEDVTTELAKQVTERISKLARKHASVIYQIP